MDEKRIHNILSEKPPLYQLFVSLLIISGVGMILLMVFLVAGMGIFGTDFSQLLNIESSSGEKNILFLQYLLIAQEISLFIVPGILILFLTKSDNEGGRAIIKMPSANDIVLVILLTICLLPVTSFTGQLNSGMHFPDWLSGVEQWMTEKEERASGLVELFMESQDNFWPVVLNIFMIAILPAIGEELIFRGIFQNIFSRLFNSGHLAIWLTSFLFSAIHLQFFGFIPRFILGLIFGYLFLWSGTIWLPIISHFLNNSFSVIGSYIQGTENLNTITDIPLYKQLIGLTLPIIVVIVILFYFRNKSKIADDRLSEL
jgi:membrane protease YdiL (CAAX protease family)